MSLSIAAAPWLPLDEVAPLAAAAGITGLDLMCRPHVFDSAKAPCFYENNAAVLDLGRSELLAPAAVRVLTEWNLSCPVLVGQTLCTDVAAARRLVQVAQVVAAPRVCLAMPRPVIGQIGQQLANVRTVWRELARIAAGEGIQFVCATHDNTVITGASSAMRVVEDLDPRHVGVILDPACMVREGNEPLAFAIELLGRHLTHIRVKDLWMRSGGTSWDGHVHGYAPLGLGVLRWPTILGILWRSGYRGGISLENLTGLDLGPARIADDVAWLRLQMQAAGVESA